MKKKIEEILQEKKLKEPLYHINGILLKRKEYFDVHEERRKRILDQCLKRVMIVYGD